MKKLRRKVSTEGNNSKRVFGSINDLPAKDKIAMIQDRMLDLQKAYFESSMKIICLQADTTIIKQPNKILDQRLFKQQFELSYNALHKELKRLQNDKEN